jgi:hypothetical protein
LFYTSLKIVAPQIRQNQSRLAPKRPVEFRLATIRRIKGDREILLLKERLNPSRLPQKEVRTVEVD